MIHFLKWSFQDEFIETALGAILRTPGLILCDYWHQKCLDYSVPKSLELTELSESSLHLSVLLLVRKSIFNSILNQCIGHYKNWTTLVFRFKLDFTFHLKENAK